MYRFIELSCFWNWPSTFRGQMRSQFGISFQSPSRSSTKWPRLTFHITYRCRDISLHFSRIWPWPLTFRGHLSLKCVLSYGKYHIPLLYRLCFEQCPGPEVDFQLDRSNQRGHQHSGGRHQIILFWSVQHLYQTAAQSVDGGRPGFDEIRYHGQHTDRYKHIQLVFRLLNNLNYIWQKRVSCP